MTQHGVILCAYINKLYRFSFNYLPGIFGNTHKRNRVKYYIHSCVDTHKSWEAYQLPTLIGLWLPIEVGCYLFNIKLGKNLSQIIEFSILLGFLCLHNCFGKLNYTMNGRLCSILVGEMILTNLWSLIVLLILVLLQLMDIILVKDGEIN